MAHCFYHHPHLAPPSSPSPPPVCCHQALVLSPIQSVDGVESDDDNQPDRQTGQFLLTSTASSFGALYSALEAPDHSKPWVRGSPMAQSRSLDSAHDCIVPPRTRRVHFSLRFTPVNDPDSRSRSDTPRPLASPGQTLDSSPKKVMSTSPRRCRLIGFTPLNEASDPDESTSSAEFLGPPQVKAKEVAPCALFYQRSDVFVSSEMETQNAYSHCHHHYQAIRFDDESFPSSTEPGLPYAVEPEPDRLSFVKPEAGSNTGFGNESAFESQSAIPIRLDAVQEALSHLFVRDRLTTMPHLTESCSMFSFPCAPPEFDEIDLADGPVTHSSTPELMTPTCSTAGDDPTTASSCGISSAMWEVATSTSTRATSPVSSLYSNVSSSCHAPLTSSVLDGLELQSKLARQEEGPRCLKSRSCGLRRSPALGPQKAFSLALPPICRLGHAHRPCHGYRDLRDDQGTLADDEGDVDTWSSQALSDDDDDAEEEGASERVTACGLPLLPGRLHKETRAMSAPAESRPKLIARP